MEYLTEDLIKLNMGCRLGLSRLKALVDHFGSLDQFFHSTENEKVQFFGNRSQIHNRLKEIDEQGLLEKEIAAIEKNKIQVISIFDSDYPEMLKRQENPPLLLYVKGSLKKSDYNSVSVVGSRDATIYGIEMASDISQALASQSITIVSGLARGIDSASHQGALKGSGRTLAVLGSGLLNLYPKENHNLAKRIVDSGALISIFPLNEPPHAYNFPIRNQVVSGLSLALVVVEAAKRSGALITAQCALDQGKDVFAFPGRVNSRTSTGTNSLIKDGAHLATNADDVIEVIQSEFIDYEPQKIPQDKKNTKGQELSNYSKKILHLLSDEPMHINVIAKKINDERSRIMREMLELEIKSLVRELPGQHYVVN